MNEADKGRASHDALVPDRAGRSGGLALSKRELWLAGQTDAFKAAVNGAPLEECLDLLISSAKEQVEGATQCAFYIANEEGTELRHVAGMPEAYARRAAGFTIGPDSLAWGLSIDLTEPVITPDVRDAPRWKEWLWLAEEAGYRGVWSFPVETAPGKLVGTFAVYFVEPQSPTAQDLHFARSLCATASIIIAQDQIRQAREEANQRLVDYSAALQREQGRQKLLLAELQHRVRNTLAVIRSMVRRTAASSATVEDFERHLDGRLGSFARTQSYVTRDPEGGVDLELIVRDELLAHAATGRQNVSIKGPEVRLNAKQAETLGLAVHELTTNAIKHGALGRDGTSIDVKWSVGGRAGHRVLKFSWKERLKGGRLVEPSRTGFGTELLDRVLRYELDAEPVIEFRPEGLSYSVAIPLPPRNPLI